MKLPLWFSLLVSFLSDVVITGGTALTTAMVAGDSAHMPTTAVWILALVGGLMAGFRALKAAISPAPGNTTGA